MAGKNQNGGSAATLDISATITGANERREAAMNDLNEARASVMEQMTALAGQLGQIDDGLAEFGVEEFEAPDLSAIDYLYEDPEPAPKARRRSTRTSNGASEKRGGGAATLSNCILISMDQSERGTEFNISEVHAAVQTKPCNYVFTGDEKGQRTVVNQALGNLVNDGHLKRVSRGVYALTAAGSREAKAALKAIG
tara:strand:- start:1224 stop:1811 length:588 start_codon:yes stop_codon:yes gene_type:complete